MASYEFPLSRNPISFDNLRQEKKLRLILHVEQKVPLIKSAMIRVLLLCIHEPLHDFNCSSQSQSAKTYVVSLDGILLNATVYPCMLFTLAVLLYL